MLRSRVLRFATASLLGLSLVSSLGCRRTTTTSEGPEPKAEGTVETADVALPDPLPLPERPRLGTWLAQPKRALAMLEPYSPQPIQVAPMAQQALMGLTSPELAEQIASGIDLNRAFSNVVLDDGQEVLRIGLTESARESLTKAFAELEPAGEFGGVHLPAAAGGEGGESREWLAWIDEGAGGFLVLANSEAGLATGRALEAAYGQQAVFFSADPRQLPIPADVPLERVEGRGSLDSLVVDVQFIAGQDPLAGQPIAPGTLAGLLEGPDIVAGISSTYADYDETVREITSEVNAQVRELPFLIRSIGEDLAASLNTLLRTWDGRSLVAMGPANHLRVAYGANDVEKSRVAMIRLLQKVIDNASIARNFTDAVPKMNLRRRVAKADGVDIELFSLGRASSFLPPEARSLIDDQGKLNIAMAWSERAGGGVMVVGPNATDELGKWLEQTAGAPSHSQTKEELVTAVFAADPASLQAIMVPGQQPDIAQLLSIGAAGPRWKIDVTPAGSDRYTVELTTPGAPKPARAQP